MQISFQPAFSASHTKTGKPKPQGLFRRATYAAVMLGAALLNTTGCETRHTTINRANPQPPLSEFNPFNNPSAPKTIGLETAPAAPANNIPSFNQLKSLPSNSRTTQSEPADFVPKLGPGELPPIPKFYDPEPNKPDWLNKPGVIYPEIRVPATQEPKKELKLPFIREEKPAAPPKPPTGPLDITTVAKPEIK